MMNHVETALERRRGRFRCLVNYSSPLFTEPYFRLLFVAPWNFSYDDFREISNLVTDLNQSFLSRLVMTNYLVVMMTDN